MLKDDFYKNLESLLKFAVDNEEPNPEDETIGDLNLAKDEVTKDESLPQLGSGADILDPDTEQPFEQALSPSAWELNKSGDGYIVFVKTDSESDPQATKGRYQKQLVMDTGKPDDAIINYINTFLTQNKIDVTPKKHLTMRTKFGPKITDEYDNDVSIVYEWRNGKYMASIKWRPKDESIKTPPQFIKEIELPDELSNQAPPMPEESVQPEEIPSLDEIEEKPTEEAEEVPEKETEESTPTEEGTEEKEEEPEEEKTPAFLIPRLVRLSSTIKHKILSNRDETLKHALLRLSSLINFIKTSAEDDDKNEEADDDENADNESPAEDEIPEKDETPKDDNTDNEEVEEKAPVSADVHEIINNILNEKRDDDKTVFQKYIEGEALQTGVLYPRDFKDLEKYRNDNDLDNLKDKENAMSDRIFGDIDRILKSEAPTEAIKKEISEVPKSELLGIIADNIERISSEDTEGRLRSDILPTDIAEVPELPDEEEVQEKPQNINPASQLVQIFYQLRGELSPLQRRKITDTELFEKAHQQYEKDFPDEDIQDSDIENAKKLISRDLEARGDLIGNP